MTAAGVSVLLGAQWGPDVLLSGFLQGAGAEVVFSATRYRNYRAPTLALAAIASMSMAFAHDWMVYYQGVDTTTMLAIGVVMLVSGAFVLPCCPSPSSLPFVVPESSKDMPARLQASVEEGIDRVALSAFGWTGYCSRAILRKGVADRGDAREGGREWS